MKKQLGITAGLSALIDRAGNGATAEPKPGCRQSSAASRCQSSPGFEVARSHRLVGGLQQSFAAAWFGFGCCAIAGPIIKADSPSIIPSCFSCARTPP